MTASEIILNIKQQASPNWSQLLSNYQRTASNQILTGPLNGFSLEHPQGVGIVGIVGTIGIVGIVGTEFCRPEP